MMNKKTVDVILSGVISNNIEVNENQLEVNVYIPDKLIVQAFSALIDRRSNKDNKTIAVWLIGEAHRRPLHTFYTMQSLENLTEFIFESEVLRSFFLDLTDLYSYLLMSENINVDEFIANLIRAITKCRPTTIRTDNALLITKEVADSIYITSDKLDKILSNNFWVLTYYILMLNLDKIKLNDNSLSAVE